MADSQFTFTKLWYKPWQFLQYSSYIHTTESYRVPIHLSYRKCEYVDWLGNNAYLAGRVSPGDYEIILRGAAGAVQETWFKYVYSKVILILLALYVISSALDNIIRNANYWVTQHIFVLLLFIALLNHADSNFVRELGYCRVKLDTVLRDFSELMLRRHGVRVKAGNYCLWIEFCRYEYFDGNLQRNLPSPIIMPYIPIFR
jgi:hypothetical protein